ncbi:hypothetical protein NIES2101_37350 [Calothrix sp. HK-06]|nr:hypothetical protein NIES2101_37350 [Calothrix sp. HK-06]
MNLYHLSFSNLYVFGDSYCDTGNAFHVTQATLGGAPNAFGRFCNGSVWVEFLAKELGLSLQPSTTTVVTENLNFAFAGATTGNDNLFCAVIPNLPKLPGLQQQIEQFLEVLKQNNQVADSEALYIISAGAADYAPFVNGVPQCTEPQKPIQNIANAIKTLASVGAKSILVVNVIDIGRTPLAAAVAEITTAKSVSQAISAHNQALASLLPTLPSYLNLTLFDAKAILDEILAEPTKFGFVNTTHACSEAEAEPEEYVFWDMVHLTRKANQILAKAVLNAVFTN